MAAPPIERLVAIMAALRAPGSGCPWDLAQDARSIAPYCVEEAYEVVDAIERGDATDLRDELGDLLLQVVFHARLAEESGLFAFDAVVEAICAKMIRRHPHVFGDKDGNVVSTADVRDQWDAVKATERVAKADKRGGGLLADVPSTLPGLTRAIKLQRKAARVGFDWGTAAPILAKIREEIDEIADALDHGDPDHVAGEIGDLFFAVANLARQVEVDPEAAVRATNRKFERRFAYIERALANRGSSPEAASLAEMDALWDEAKANGL